MGQCAAKNATEDTSGVARAARPADERSAEEKLDVLGSRNKPKHKQKHKHRHKHKRKESRHHHSVRAKSASIPQSGSVDSDGKQKVYPAVWSHIIAACLIKAYHQCLHHFRKIITSDTSKLEITQDRGNELVRHALALVHRGNRSAYEAKAFMKLRRSQLKLADEDFGCLTSALATDIIRLLLASHVSANPLEHVVMSHFMNHSPLFSTTKSGRQRVKGPSLEDFFRMKEYIRIKASPYLYVLSDEIAKQYKSYGTQLWIKCTPDEEGQVRLSQLLDTFEVQHEIRFNTSLTDLVHSRRKRRHHRKRSSRMPADTVSRHEKKHSRAPKLDHEPREDADPSNVNIQLTEAVTAKGRKTKKRSRRKRAVEKLLQQNDHKQRGSALDLPDL